MAGDAAAAVAAARRHLEHVRDTTILAKASLAARSEDQ